MEQQSGNRFVFKPITDGSMDQAGWTSTNPRLAQLGRHMIEPEHFYSIINATTGEPAGVMSLSVEANSQQQSMRIDTLYIKDQYRAQGLGRRAIRYAAGVARHKDIHQLEVISRPEAVAFYETQGFSLTPGQERAVLPLMSKDTSLKK